MALSAVPGRRAPEPSPRALSRGGVTPPLPRKARLVSKKEPRPPQAQVAALSGPTLALEVETVQSLALAQGVPLDKAMLKLKGDGLSALVLTEETVGDLMTTHEIEVASGPVLKGSENQ